MSFPFMIVLLPAFLWRYTLAVAAALAIIAGVTRGRARFLAALGAILLALPGLAGAAYEFERKRDMVRIAEARERRRTVLPADAVIEGLRLPAGTALTWRDETHRDLFAARPPGPIPLLGVVTTGVEAADTGWALETAAPHEVGGWPCDAGVLTFARDGTLRDCFLSRAVPWRGWHLPVGTRTGLGGDGREYDPPPGGLALDLPTGSSLPAPEIGRPLPGNAMLNADGSLASASFPRDPPLLVAGVPLWGEVRWRYDAATLGAGRARRAVAVDGTRVTPRSGSEGMGEGERVRVHLPGGAVERLPDGGE